MFLYCVQWLSIKYDYIGAPLRVERFPPVRIFNVEHRVLIKSALCLFRTAYVKNTIRGVIIPSPTGCAMRHMQHYNTPCFDGICSSSDRAFADLGLMREHDFQVRGITYFVLTADPYCLLTSEHTAPIFRTCVAIV